LLLDMVKNYVMYIFLNIFGTYKGVLSPEGNELAFELYERAKEKPNTLIITSDGGDIMLGIELGRWVYDNKMSVEVNDYCLSSCANYVFTAGKIKYISNRAIIGFHGGATSEVFKKDVRD
ncbi:hypothetical protein ACP3XP_00195, partial [Vibrio anguillarum]